MGISVNCPEVAEMVEKNHVGEDLIVNFMFAATSVFTNRTSTLVYTEQFTTFHGIVIPSLPYSDMMLPVCMMWVIHNMG